MKVIDDWFKAHPNLVVNYVLGCILETINFLETQQNEFDYDIASNECFVNDRDIEKIADTLKNMGFSVSKNNTLLKIQW